jgi:ribosome-binding protein aMBF1 (putative translation factor)
MAKLFSDQLREPIRKSGWSGYALAKELDIPQSQLSRFMNDKGGLQQSNIDKVCKLIGVRLVADKPKGKPKRKAT